MSGLGTIQLPAAIAAVACLLCPLIGRFLIRRREGSGFRRPLHPALVWLGLCLASGTVVAFAWTGTLDRSDTIFLAIISLAMGFGLTNERFQARRAVKLAVQAVLAAVVAWQGGRLPVTSGAYPAVEIACTIVFVIGVLNALAILNFLDGLASLAVFILSASAAIVLNLSIGTDEVGDPAGIIFALSLCGLSLWFFIYSRPSAKAYMGDYGTLMLKLGAALLLVRLLAQQHRLLNGAVVVNPAIFLPFLLIIPILLASVHREQKALFRRSRLALILILIGHLPYIIPIATATPPARLMASALLAIASVIVWTGLTTQGRTLRGWSMRCMAEPVADALRHGLIVGGVSLILALWAGIHPLYVLFVTGLTTGLLTLQVSLWRRRVDTARLPEVAVFGPHEAYRQAQFVFMNCADLFGRRRMRRSRVGLNSKHLRTEVLKELQSGNTVLVLDHAARRALIGLRGYDDLIFASDCLLLRHIDPHMGPRRLSRANSVLHDYTHRAVAIAALLFLAPVFLTVAALIRLDDGGPIFFRQRRLGAYGRRFTLLKFRSMRIDAPKYGESPRTAVDARVTRVGRVIRKLSLDELPQLINVARGEMRLVGPRPEMPFICATYTPRQRKRLDVPPGITGLWQISPHRNDPIHDHVEYDLAYACARGPVLDLAIILATILAALKTGY